MRWYLILVFGALSYSGYTQVDNVLTSKFTVTQNGTNLTIPYGASHPIDISDADLKYLVFSIHGVNRNANDYYDRMITAKNRAGEDGDSTLIIAPQFLTESDIDAFSLPSEYLYWSSGGWIAGSNSRNETSNPRPERISSYQVLDSMILRIINTIPTIEYITIVGHSAGGQVVQRYAASSPLAGEDAIDQRIRFIVANPSSYVYLDEKRRVGGSLDEFAVPSTSCSQYNEWKFGLDDLFNYPNRQGVMTIRNNYKNAEIVYLLGGEDNDPNSSSLDTDCEAQLQGAHRLERGTIYYNYLQDYYGEQVHQIDTVPGVGHSSSGMFSSDEGVFHIFEAVGSKKNTTSTREYVYELGSLFVYPNPTNDWIRIESPSKGSEAVQYRIFDLTGRWIQYFSNRKELNGIDLSGLSQGAYLVQAQLGFEIFQEKILKL